MANCTIDGILLAFNNKFLTNLIEENYSISNIRFKYTSANRPSVYRTFATYQDFVTFFRPFLSDPNYACLSGQFLILESISLDNNKMNFDNSYVARNITKNVNVQRNFKYDAYRKKFNESQTKLYQSYLTRRFTNYLTDTNTLIKLRNQQYIESCWIDIDYFEGDSFQLLTV